VANAITPGLAGVPVQTWKDRLREAAYTSPRGTRIRFDYESVTREVDARGTVFEFSGVDDAYVQQNGHGPRRYPMTCYFSGADHDRIATAFEAALLEPGKGKLEHPRYGTVTVVPFGTISRRDDLKEALNQTVIEVTFWTTVGAVYPTSEADAQSEILAALAGFDVAAAQQLADSTNLAGALNQAAGKATLRNLLKQVSAGLTSVSDTVTSITRAFRDLQSEINFGMDVLIGQPLLLARQISNLITMPGRALTGIEARLAAYGALADSIFGSSAANPAEHLATGTSLLVRTTRVANDFHFSDLFAMGTVAGSVVAVTADPIGESGQPVPGGSFTTRPQAILAADAVLAQFEAVVAWRDAGFAALEQLDALGAYQLDPGASYQALQQAVALAAGNLVQTSFSLVAERRIVLDRPRTIIDLAAEIYGAVDSRLDLLINTNNLTGEEILELPRGKSIAYYPES
jgi:hypothetical protein